MDTERKSKPRKTVQIVNWECTGCGSKIKHSTSVFTHKKKCIRYVELQEKKRLREVSAIAKPSTRVVPNRFLVSVLMGEAGQSSDEESSPTSAGGHTLTCAGCMQDLRDFKSVVNHQSECTGRALA
jgi:hypothetical protein